MLARLICSFAGVSDADFLVAIGNIIAALSANPGFPEPWPDFVPTLAQLRAVRNKFELACYAAQNGDHIRIAERIAVRVEFEELIKRLPPYLELVANGDVPLLETTGFALHRERVHINGPLEAPANVRVEHGAMPGSLVVRAGKVRGAHSYHVYTTQGAPEVEAGWLMALTSTSIRSVTVEGLNSGQYYWVRLRAIGSEGPGLWSDPIRALVH